MRLLAELVTLASLLSCCVDARTWQIRAKKPLASFDDANNVPRDDYIDDGTTRAGITAATSADAFDAVGAPIDISDLGAQIMGESYNYLRCYDVGFCDCGKTALPTASQTPPAETTDGMANVASRCHISPFIMPNTGMYAGFKYHMAYRKVDQTNVYNQHDTDRIGAEVNTALDQYRTTFQTDKAIIITWKITSTMAPTDVNHFQAIIATGNSTTYILFLYDTLPSAGTGVQGHINGEYTAGSEKFARICPEYVDPAVTTPATAAQLTSNANKRCGNAGIYLFNVHDAADACTDPAGACSTQVKLNCNMTRVPQDTCTETFNCVRDGTNGILNISLIWYKFPTIAPLTYNKWIGTGTVDNPLGKQDFYNEIPPSALVPRICSANMTNADTPSASYTHSISFPIPLSAVPEFACGMKWNPVGEEVSFAFKVHDGISANEPVDQAGELIIYGTCSLLDQPSQLEVTLNLNDASPPTEVPFVNRSKTIHAVDRNGADGAQEITEALIGRGVYLLVSYFPGDVWNLWAHPFAPYVEFCDASNNGDFVDERTTFGAWKRSERFISAGDAANNGNFVNKRTIANTWKRSERFITAGCPVDQTTLGAISVNKSFSADPNHIPATGNDPDGSPWYQVSGRIVIGKWNIYETNTPHNDIHIRCFTRYCTGPDEVSKCLDYCTSDKRKRRSVDEEINDGTGDYLYTKITVIDPEESSPKPEKTKQCTNFNTAMTTMVILLAMLLLVSTLTILLFMKLSSMKKTASTKKGSL